MSDYVWEGNPIHLLQGHKVKLLAVGFVVFYQILESCAQANGWTNAFRVLKTNKWCKNVNYWNILRTILQLNFELHEKKESNGDWWALPEPVWSCRISVPRFRQPAAYTRERKQKFTELKIRRQNATAQQHTMTFYLKYFYHAKRVLNVQDKKYCGLYLRHRQETDLELNHKLRSGTERFGSKKNKHIL